MSFSELEERRPGARQGHRRQRDGPIGGVLQRRGSQAPREAIVGPSGEPGAGSVRNAADTTGNNSQQKHQQTFSAFTDLSTVLIRVVVVGLE